MFIYLLETKLRNKNRLYQFFYFQTLEMGLANCGPISAQTRVFLNGIRPAKEKSAAR